MTSSTPATQPTGLGHPPCIRRSDDSGQRRSALKTANEVPHGGLCRPGLLVLLAHAPMRHVAKSLHAGLLA